MGIEYIANPMSAYTNQRLATEAQLCVRFLCEKHCHGSQRPPSPTRWLAALRKHPGYEQTCVRKDRPPGAQSQSAAVRSRVPCPGQQKSDRTIVANHRVEECDIRAASSEELGARNSRINRTSPRFAFIGIDNADSRQKLAEPCHIDIGEGLDLLLHHSEIRTKVPSSRI